MKTPKKIQSFTFAALSLSILLAILFSIPNLKTLDYWYYFSSDWDSYLFLMTAWLKPITEFGQFPWWNPYYCGGHLAYEHPQFALFRLPTLFFLIFEPLQAFKLEYVLHYFVGILGCLFLGRHLFGKQSLLLLLIPSLLYTFSGYSVSKYAIGQVNYSGYTFVPWILFFYLLSFKGHRSRYLWTSGFLTFLLLASGSYFFYPATLFFMGIFGTCLWVISRDVKHFYAMGSYFIKVLALSAFKIIPTVEFLSRHPRVETLHDVTPWTLFPKMLFYDYNFESLDFREGYHTAIWFIHEYYYYIGVVGGIFTLLFMIAGLFKVFTKKDPEEAETAGVPDSHIVAAAFLCSILFILLGYGQFHEYAPFSILLQMPVMKNTHVAARYFIFGMFGIMILSFYGTSYLQKLARKPSPDYLRTAIPVTLIVGSVIIFGDLLRVKQRFWNQAFQADFGPRWEQLPKNDEFGNAGTNAYDFLHMYPALKNNVQAYHCKEGVPTAYKGKNLKEDWMFASHPDVDLKDLTFTPNVTRAVVSNPTAATQDIFLNQNYNKGWTASFDGRQTEIEMAHGLPVVRLAPGQQGTLSFSYFPVVFWHGIAASLGLLFVAMIWDHLLFPRLQTSPARRRHFPPGDYVSDERS